jgi:hypothetical protein
MFLLSVNLRLLIAASVMNIKLGIGVAGASIASWALGTNLSAAPLTWFPGPALDQPMSGSAVVTNAGAIILTGGDAYANYYYGLSYPLSLQATNGYWSYLAPFYSLNIAPGAVISDGNIVIYGGTDGSNAQSATISYNLTGDTTPALPDMQTARAYLGYATDRSRNAYAFGGLDASGNPLASAERLNPAANTPAWTYIASLPGPRYNFPAVFNGTNYIYAFGGLTDPATGVESATVLRYSISGNTWSTLAPMPVPVAGSAAALAPDGRIYVAGGTSGGVPTDTLQVYDPSANSWTLSTPLPEALTLAAISVDSLGRLLVMGGQGIDGTDVADVWRSQPFGAADSPPQLSQLPATNAAYLGTYSSSITATGNPPPTYTLLTGPAGLSVDYYTGAIAWTPQGLSQIGSIPVTIQVTNYAGGTNWTFAITVPNPAPAPPTNLTVTATTENSVTLSWGPEDPVVGAVTYSVWLKHVLHSPKGSGATVWYTQIGGTTTETSITIGGLAAGLAQAYYVKATGPGGTSGYASIGAATLPAPSPANLRVTGLTSTTITLAWDAPAGGFPVASYELIGWYNGIAAQYPLDYANLQGTSATITGLAPGTALLWGVRALDTAGNNSAYDYLPSLAINPAPQRALLSANTPPQTPAGFQFNVQSGTARTTWIQATTNPADPAAWLTLATNPPGSNSFLFTDTNSSQFPARFYRVITP